MAPFLGDWLWQSAGGGPPEAAGYAVVAQGGFSNPYSYDLVSHVVAPESAFFKVPAGGSCSSGGGYGFFDLAQTVGGTGNQRWEFSTRSLSAGPELHTAHTLTTCAGNDSVSVLVMFENLPPLSVVSGQSYDYSSNLSTVIFGAGGSTAAASFNFHGVSSAAKGYFYGYSIDLSSHAVLASDGPAQPTTFVSNTQAPMSGSAAIPGTAIIQYIETTSSTVFSSNVYDFTSAMTSAGPNFLHAFSPESVVFTALNSAGISSSTEAVFFEKGSAFSGIFDSATEIYDFTAKNVSLSSAIPNQGNSSVDYFYAGNSNPGSF